MFKIKVKNLFTLTILYICQLIHKIRGKKFVHVIGDSHTLAFQDYRLKVHYLGPVTAYNLVKENSSSKGREKLFKIINSFNNQAVLLVFGEIDARIHIYNQYMINKKKISLEKKIDEVVRNYCEIIKEIKNKGMNVIVYNIVPPGHQKNYYKFPYYAEWGIRLKITKIMNKKLEDFCRKNNVLFLNIFNKVINSKRVSEKFFRKKEYIFDDVHLNNKISPLIISDLKQKKVI